MTTLTGPTWATETRSLEPSSPCLESLADLLPRRLVSHGDRVATRHDTGERYANTTYAQIVDHAGAFARWLIGEGRQQQVIVTLCKNRPEWDITALAALHTANILCPLDTTLNRAELNQLISLRAPEVMLVSRAQLGRARELQSSLGFRAELVIADLHVCYEDVMTPAPELGAREHSLAAICADRLHHEPPPASPLLDDASTVLAHYATSGTTTLPRLVRITHGNLIAAIDAGFDVINLRPNEDVLNLGPYTHIGALMEFLVTKTRGFTVSYMTREPDEPGVLEGEIQKLRRQGVHVKALMAVPSFWIYLLKEVLEELRVRPVLRDLADKLVAIEKHSHLHNLGTIDKAKLTATRLMLRNKLGGYFSYGISASTRLDSALTEIFGKLGITVLDIYGATECTGIIARSRLNEIHAGTSGRILPTLEWRLGTPRRIPGWPEEVGLLEVKGPTIAAGYVGPDGTTTPLSVSSDGWLATGDLAWIDAEGCVRLVGREKELIAWPGGWLLDPQHLSNLISRSMCVKEAMVVHEHPDDPYLSVFVFPDWPRVRLDPQWRRDVAAGLSEDAALKRRLVDAIEYAASLVAAPARLDTNHIRILPRKLERTPTHKIKYVLERSRMRDARAI